MYSLLWTYCCHCCQMQREEVLFRSDCTVDAFVDTRRLEQYVNCKFSDNFKPGEACKSPMCTSKSTAPSTVAALRFVDRSFGDLIGFVDSFHPQWEVHLSKSRQAPVSTRLVTSNMWFALVSTERHKKNSAFRSIERNHAGPCRAVSLSSRVPSEDLVESGFPL